MFLFKNNYYYTCSYYLRTSAVIVELGDALFTKSVKLVAVDARLPNDSVTGGCPMDGETSGCSMDGETSGCPMDGETSGCSLDNSRLKLQLDINV